MDGRSNVTFNRYRFGRRRICQFRNRRKWMVISLLSMSLGESNQRWCSQVVNVSLPSLCRAVMDIIKLDDTKRTWFGGIYRATCIKYRRKIREPSMKAIEDGEWQHFVSRGDADSYIYSQIYSPSQRTTGMNQAWEGNNWTCLNGSRFYNWAIHANYNGGDDWQWLTLYATLTVDSDNRIEGCLYRWLYGRKQP